MRIFRIRVPGPAWSIIFRNHNAMTEFTPPVIAILGGGQLGRMLIRELIPYSPTILVVDPDADAPCKFLANRFLCCSLYDDAAILEFCKEADVVTIEIEHVSVDVLRALKKQGKKVVPDPEVLCMVQDKGLQKAFFSKNNIPTMPYSLIERKIDYLPPKVAFRPFAQKTRTGGYDGKGVQLIRTREDWEQKAWDVPSVLEELADLKAEIAVMACGDFGGKRKQWPAVEMEFDPQANLVTLLFSPSRLPDAVLEEAARIAEKLSGLLNAEGLLAIEFFVTKDDRVWVNEIAPRPHNSGHHTMEASETGQFAQLARILCGFSLGETQLRSAAAMINLLGGPSFSGKVKYEGLAEAMEQEGVYVHLYGKQQTKPGRKMGHCTVIEHDTVLATARARQILHLIKVKA